MPGSSRVKRCIGIGLLVVLMVPLARMYQVHSYGDEMTLFPSAAPPEIVLDGRDYRRGSPQSELPRDVVVLDETMGGGVVYGPSSALTPTGVHVVDGDTIWSYGLIGGP
ncbi:MAG TPA: hypothetical protein VD859_04355 [Nocardioides sp.]|nr:hypothetical protein [Nocardioides sp.]